MAVQPLSPVPGPPDLAGAYGRGGALALQRQQLEQQAIESERNAQIQRQQIAAQQQIANQRAMQAQTQAAIENQINQSRLGLAEREMAAQEAEFERRSQEAARTFQARQMASERIAAGEDPTAVYQEMLPMLDMPASAVPNAQFQPQETNIGGTRMVQTGPQRWQVVDEAGPEMKTGERARIERDLISGIRSQINQLERARSGSTIPLEPGDPEYDRIQMQIDKLNDEMRMKESNLNALMNREPEPEIAPPPASYDIQEGPGGIRMRREGAPRFESSFQGGEFRVEPERATEGGAGIKILNIRRKEMSPEQRRSLQSF